jgi:preprotein translocase YajC subunit
MKPKDDVVTIGGLHGTVVDIEGDSVTLLVDKKNNVKMKFRRSAIDSVNPPKDDDKK